MKEIFELFSGGVFFEVNSVTQAKTAQTAGAVALLLAENSPILPGTPKQLLHDIQKNTTLPIFASFHPGHFIEAEILMHLQCAGGYADSRLIGTAQTDNEFAKYYKNIPLLQDISPTDNQIPVSSWYVPVLRAQESLESLIPLLQKKTQVTGVAGAVKTISDIALLKRSGADFIILPGTIFETAPHKEYLSHLVQASFIFDDTEKLAQLMH